MSIARVEFISAPPDYTVLESLPLIFDNGKTSGASTPGGGSGSGGGGGGTPISTDNTLFLSTQPLTSARNVYKPVADTVVGIDGRDFSNTHSANKYQLTNKDGTIIYGGITGFGSSLALGSVFFTNTKNAFEVRPFGTSAGNTGEIRFLELAANGVNYVGFKSPDALAANVIFTLPSADGLSNYILITSGAKVLSFNSIAGLIDVANGLSIAESGAHHAIVGITTNGIALDRIQVASANSKLLGSGSAGIGLTYAEITLGTGLSMSGTTLNATSGMTNPMTTLGDIIYEDATPVPARLAGNTTSTQKFLAQTGTGTISAAPSWVAITLPVGANPSASIGLTTVNGSATTFMRSDGAPAIDQGIAPTWTGLHTFNGAANINAPTGTVGLQIVGAAGVSIVGILDSTAQNILSVIGGAGNVIDLGDVATVSSTVAVVSIAQRNATEIGLIIKQYTSGASLQQWRTSGDAVFSEMTSSGLSLGGATPGARLDIRQGTLGLNLITLNNQGSVVHNILQNAVTTVGNVAGIVHIYQTTTGSVLFIKNWIIGRVTVGAGVVGNGVVIEFLAAFRNVGGVVTQIGADTKTVLTDDAAYTAASNINGTTVELKVTGKIGHNLTWDVIQLNGAY